ncbi:PorV/PorQ family protein [Hymenobacter sp. CRA2]|uniref:putative type IX sorting system protein PorV2 n=1 Tax=Hymenobacter sp. CRA2 TaxID=1955620 RepID=UPI00098F8CE8|nr:PorV/PorQ family protein [Hymenobacter sp. CRA2]OON68627.1 hypothetical protein B0919_13395 [Hymenobacter sp. CRA2]
MPHFFRRSIIVLSAVSLVSTGAAQAQAVKKDKTPKYTNEFLNIGVGGRAQAMGSTQVSLAQDATAGYWNPAGLVGQKTKYDAVLMHSELFSGVVKNDYAAFSMPLDERSAIGATIIRVGVDDIPNTQSLINQYNQVLYDRVTYFSVADYGMLLSYARKLESVEGLQVGANAKIIYRNYGSFGNAWGFGVDAGAQYTRGSWRFGLMARDITTTYNVWSMHPEKFTASMDSLAGVPKNSTEIALPRFVLGVSRQFTLPKDLSLVAAVDLEMTTDGKRNTLVSSDLVSIAPHAGLELGYRNLVFLRGGATNVQKYVSSVSLKEQWSVQPTLGVGLALSGLRLDVALSRLAIEKIAGQSSQANSVMVSLGYGFK